jgi:hypothetical protein
MNPTLARAIIALVLSGSVCVVTGRAFRRTRALGSFLELIGAAGLATLGVTHLCEGLHLLPWMRWGMEGSPGHYLNLASLAVAITLLPLGYVLAKRHRVAERRASPSSAVTRSFGAITVRSSLGGGQTSSCGSSLRGLQRPR